MPDIAGLALEAFERAQAETQEGDRDAALRWLDRAARLVPRDQTVAMALAAACLGLDDRRAAALFAGIGARHDVREAWLGLATARRRLGDEAGAAAAIAEALRRHVPDHGLASLAATVAQASHAPGWCGLSGDGRLAIEPGSRRKDVVLTLDGRRIASVGERLARGWQNAMSLAVTTRDGTHLLGSPLDIAAITATAGCVSARDGALVGWAWHPSDPDTDPLLSIHPVAGGRSLSVKASDPHVDADSGLLARPRGFVVPPEALMHLKGPLHVRGRDGNDLAGSPLDPRAEWHSAAAAAAMIARFYPARRAPPQPQRLVPPPALPVASVVPRISVAGTRQRRPVDIVVPVHGGTAHVRACLDSVLATLKRPARLIVIDDASRDPDLVRMLDRMAARKQVTLVRNARNLGFAASANIGMRASNGNDVVLLNSDTLVPPGWLEDLRDIAYSASDIGTVTPLSNDASILSYPNLAGGNIPPDFAETRRIATLARRVNCGSAIDIPVAIGFCMYIRRACLDDVGLLRADVFAQGYGEENDFCLRARHLGWRHVAASGVFVAHVGGQSFGAAGRHLRARNSELLERLHPGYARLIETHVRADPLAEARRRLDLARWRAARRRGGEAVVLVTHDSGGGVERQVAASVERHRASGRRAIVLRPSTAPDGRKCITVGDGTEAGFPNLRYAMPDELPALQRLLVAEHPRAVELHHMVGHHPSVLDLIAALGVPYDVRVHDYAWLCGRIALVGPAERYCGEPETARCEACIADAGNLIEEDISVGDLRRRSARLFARARSVIVPSADTAERIGRHFPATRHKVAHHEDDRAIADPPAPSPATARCRVCVIGAIGIHKGYQVVLNCARDAAERRLPLEFVVVGNSIDDRRLLATGRVFVTGSFAPDEAVCLIKAQQATLALLPSIFPETWCFTLAEAWRAGLQVAAFDIGAQAERIRETGRGLLLPLGLPPNAINNALVAVAGLSGHE
jgi:GT2 family glycosyltransferase